VDSESSELAKAATSNGKRTPQATS
jgi:hypothetical protein